MIDDPWWETPMTAISSGQACPERRSERREMQYVYQDGDGYVFVDAESDATITVPLEWAGDALLYLREGDRAHVIFDGGQPRRLEPPDAVALTVSETEPASADRRLKPALLETGLRVMVPAGVGVGETVLVDTRQGTYLGRA
jgi:elongation factor P